jgi:hypothetical protein
MDDSPDQQPNEPAPVSPGSTQRPWHTFLLFIPALEHMLLFLVAALAGFFSHQREQPSDLSDLSDLLILNLYAFIAASLALGWWWGWRRAAQANIFSRLGWAMLSASGVLIANCGIAAAGCGMGAAFFP